MLSDVLYLCALNCLVILCVYGCFCLKSVVDGVNRRFKRLEAVLESSADAVAVSAVHAAKNIEKVSDVACNVSNSVGFVVDGYTIGAILVAVYAICRNIYLRFASKEKKEKLSESEVLKLFDMAALVGIVPLLVGKGPQAALKVYGSLKWVCSAVRTTCGGLQVLTRLFDNKEVPFVPAVSVDKIVDAVDELGDRVEEKKQVFGSSYTFTSGIDLRASSDNVQDASLYPPLVRSNAVENVKHESDEEVNEEKKMDPKVHLPPCKECKKEGCCGAICGAKPVANSTSVKPVANSASILSHLSFMKPPSSDLVSNQQGKIDALQASGQTDRKGLGASVKVPIAWPVDSGKRHKALEGVETLASDRNTRGSLRDLEQIMHDKPWLIPVVLLMLYGALLVLARYLNKSKEDTVVIAKKGSFWVREGKKKNKGKSYIVFEKKTYIASSSSDEELDADEQGISVDDEGNLVRHVGRRAARKGVTYRPVDVDVADLRKLEGSSGERKAPSTKKEEVASLQCF